MGKSWNYPSHSKGQTLAQQNWRVRQRGAIRPQTRSNLEHDHESCVDIVARKNPTGGDLWGSPYDGGSKRFDSGSKKSFVGLLDGTRVYSNPHTGSHIAYLSPRSAERHQRLKCVPTSTATI